MGVGSRLKSSLKAKDYNEKSGNETSYGRWSNIDLEPTPPSQRNWSKWYYFCFQFSIAFSPTT